MLHHAPRRPSRSRRCKASRGLVAALAALAALAPPGALLPGQRVAGSALADERDQPADADRDRDRDGDADAGAAPGVDAVSGGEPAGDDGHADDEQPGGAPDRGDAAGEDEGEGEGAAGEGEAEGEGDGEGDGDGDGAAGEIDAAADALARPWARGVSLERQERARAIYAEANDLLHEYLLEEAMEKYREALSHWEHPAIHYNLARALDSLGRPLEADAHMQPALRYGAAAYSELEYTQVLNFRRLLDQKLSTVVFVSEEEDIAIALDGDDVLTGRGRVDKRVLPGEHILVVRRPGQGVVTRLLELERGRQTRIDFDARLRWAWWQPWTVLGAGALVGVTGGVLQWRAQENMARYQERFGIACPTGCPDDSQPALARLRGRARWQNRAGVGSMISGGVLVVTGAILVALNQPRSFRIDANRRLGPTVTPMLGPDGAGLTVAFEF